MRQMRVFEKFLFLPVLIIALMKLILNHSTTNEQQRGTGGLQGWTGQDEEWTGARHGCSARRSVLAVHAQAVLTLSSSAFSIKIPAEAAKRRSHEGWLCAVLPVLLRGTGWLRSRGHVQSPGGKPGDARLAAGAGNAVSVPKALEGNCTTCPSLSPESCLLVSRKGFRNKSANYKENTFHLNYCTNIPSKLLELHERKNKHKKNLNNAPCLRVAI